MYEHEPDQYLLDLQERDKPTLDNFVVGANGEVIAKASDKEEILYADIDMKRSAEIRNSRHYTQLRRTEFYR